MKTDGSKKKEKVNLYVTVKTSKFLLKKDQLLSKMAVYLFVRKRKTFKNNNDDEDDDDE